MTDEILAQIAAEAARAASEVLRRQFRRSSLEVRTKGRHDFVTAADREAEEVILSVLRSHVPDASILAEEGGRSGGSAELEWVVDPLDGTNNFLQGLPIYCTSIACRRHGRPVAGVVLEPETDSLFSAWEGGGAWHDGRRMTVSDLPGLDSAFLATGYPFRNRAALDLYLEAFRRVFFRARGIRRCGAAALDLAYTAAGVYDGFFEFRLSPWDIAAGVVLVREAGGEVSDLDGGGDYFRSGNVVAGAPAVWRELQALIAQVAGEAEIEEADPVERPVGC